MNEIPGLSKGEFGFEGTINLHARQGFQSRNGAYGSQNSKELSDGTCTLATGGDMVEDDPKIQDYHIRAYIDLMANQEGIKGIILEKLFAVYSDLQEQYGYEDDEKGEFMPDITNVNDFDRLIGISTIHLLNIEKDGIGYVGYEFGCCWDEEHGLGVMMHKDRVIEIGGADSSFLTWIARKDLE